MEKGNERIDESLTKKFYLETCPYANWNENCRVSLGVHNKTNANASINKYKARLIAKGYTQQYGVDYQKTFAHLTNINTIQILISLAANID